MLWQQAIQAWNQTARTHCIYRNYAMRVNWSVDLNGSAATANVDSASACWENCTHLYHHWTIKSWCFSSPFFQRKRQRELLYWVNASTFLSSLYHPSLVAPKEYASLPKGWTPQDCVLIKLQLPKQMEILHHSDISFFNAHADLNVFNLAFKIPFYWVTGTRAVKEKDVHALQFNTAKQTGKSSHQKHLQDWTVLD